LNWIKYILAFTFLLQTSSKSIIYLRFLNQQDFVVKNLCEKKNTKKNKCNGKCHLKKQMKKDDASQNNTSDNKKEKNETNYTLQSLLSFSLVTVETANLMYKKEKIFSLTSFHSKLIKPPSV
jgi:hypothetical protein